MTNERRCMTVKLGISSFSFCWAVGVPGQMPEKPLSLLDLIEMTHEYGLNLLQIGDNLPLHLVESEVRAQAREKMQEYGIELEVGTRGLTDEILETYLPIAVEFQSKILRIVIDFGAYEPDEEEIVETLKRWLPKFEEKKVCLAIENHDRFEAKQLARILRRADSECVGICLDAANSLGALEGVEAVMDRLIPYTVNLHAKDVSIARLPSQLGFKVAGASAGTGNIDMKRLIHATQRNGKNANCILEQWTPFENSLEDTIRRERESADRAVAWLKKALAVEPGQETRFGASAAYTLSACGPYFTVDDICQSMRELSEDGFVGYQPELSFEHALNEWEDGGLDKVNRTQRETGIRTEQLICHFIMDYFETEDKVFSSCGYAELERFIALGKKLDNCCQILLPIGPLTLKTHQPTHEYIQRLHKAYVAKLYDFARMVQKSGLDVSFELLPGNFIGSYNALFEAMEHEGLTNFGINFDTGHAIANGENVYELARVYGSRMMLTHLGDPAMPGGTKQAPGCGMVDWSKLIPLLRESGYNRTLDLEIMAASDKTRDNYRKGKAHIEKYID